MFGNFELAKRWITLDSDSFHPDSLRDERGIVRKANAFI